MAHDDVPSPAPRTVHLAASGVDARILPDPHGDGHVLEVGGHAQSHVDLARPQEVRYEYLRRIANVLDLLAPAGAPLRVLHLGGGALTLPRYVASTRPGSAQTAVDLDRELMGLVLDELPLPADADVQVVIGDARAAVDDLLDPLEGESSAGAWDAVVLDIDTDSGAVAHLTGAAFHAELLALLSPGGALLVNIGDDDGLAHLGTQLTALEAACAEAGVPGPWTLGPASVLDRLELGNAVLAAGPGLRTLDRDALAAAGPHPGLVLDEHGTAELAERIERA
ncbi:spermidine synthase [Micrococcus flavus]|uniref:Uncharacterized protein n=1 Tax=Micrococcus flavus TaxID=384602 RepID=A0A4Y8WZB6_9MICC|nr:fused MFS/spermidine synthase [Micrococcus flavus]MBB4883891.1 hypothetical protein [Micrococcus flavus]TFI00094.1 spermidine synthase [Micrococcus flavus]